MRLDRTTMPLAAIATFNPRLDELRFLVDYLANEGIDTLLVDNGSANVAAVERMIADTGGCKLIPLGLNRGIAAAQNIAFEISLRHGYQFTLLLDQDSRPPTGMVPIAIRSINHLLTTGSRVAAVGPRLRDSRTGYLYPLIKVGRFRVRTVQPRMDFEEVSLLISSGSLIINSALRDVGMMNEQLFVDHVDTEWCFRAARNGYKIYILSNVVMDHAVGDNTRTILGRNLPLHDQERRYVATRNLFYLIMHERTPIPWKVKETITSMAKLLVTLPSTNRKWSHVVAYARGVVDGACGRMETFSV